MFGSSKLQTRAIDKMRKKWRFFCATDFESLMCPCFIFCQILGIFPYKIDASVFKTSKPRYVISTIAICVCFIGFLTVFCMINIYGITKFKGVPRIIERNCFYILSSFIAVVTYILSGPRMRLLQTIMEISSKLPPESYHKLSKLIHAKDVLGSIFIVSGAIYFSMDIHIVLQFFLMYVYLLIFQMDMLYMNCVCVLKACLKRINDNLEHMRELMIENEVYHLDPMYKHRSPFLLIELRALKRQHLTISNTVQMLNIIFSLQLLATIIITFGEITFHLYFHILYWQDGTILINIDDSLYATFLTISITYYFIKIALIVWACETGKDQAVRIATTVHDVLNSVSNNEIKAELHLFSMQIMHREIRFAAMGLNVDATLLTTIVGNISTYLIILMQFLTMPQFCNKEVILNVTQITQ
ncbi:putative gustatory receptor 28a [Solenopsis invicta]|uniref:putative gustatory receptor 28a n=1 Tax=Solenopsis invicta TaxID=13686 RepID=UPI00193CE281|nr:putative gustatory receptor 28a [Solenopsis invicta]